MKTVVSFFIKNLFLFYSFFGLLDMLVNLCTHRHTHTYLLLFFPQFLTFFNDSYFSLTSLSRNYVFCLCIWVWFGLGFACLFSCFFLSPFFSHNSPILFICLSFSLYFLWSIFFPPLYSHYCLHPFCILFIHVLNIPSFFYLPVIFSFLLMSCILSLFTTIWFI